MEQRAKYQYQRRLGGGGMAEVFLAATVGAEGFTRPVAIKRVLPSFSEDSNFSTMFVNEARISSILRHPNIVQVLDFDRDLEGRLYLVMELVEGKDLDDLAQKGLLPVPVTVYVITETLRGLAHAHEMTTPEGKPLGIVHRDISPHNVLVSWDGAVKVSDFGIAKAMQASGVGQSGMIKGKPMYMAPEQVTSPETLDHRADLFAVGVMLYELLTGERVYRGTSNEEVLTDIIQVAKGWRQLVAPTVTRPDLPWDVAQVAMMLLAPDRANRFSSARDAVDALLATSSASARGGEMLSNLILERFPGEAPPRVVRRSGQGPGLVAGPDGATWMVSGSRPQQGLFPAGTPPEEVAAAKSAPTRTVSPGGGLAAPAGPTAETVAGKVPRAKSGGRGVIIGIAGIVVVAAAVAITLIATGGGTKNASSAPPDATTRAAVPVDAGTTGTTPSTPSDAAVPAAVDAGAVVVPVTPDAAPVKTKQQKHRKRDAGTDSTIHEIKIDEGG